MRRGAALSVLALAAGAAGAEPQRYVLDPEHAFVHFEVRHFSTSTLRGRFGPISGEVTLDREARRGEVGLRVPTANVYTGVPVLDARLRESDLLDSAGSPEAFFVARDFRFRGEALAAVNGEFTLRGVSQPLELKALRWACRDDAARGTQVCGGDFEAQLDRSAFGLTFGLPFVGDRVRLLVTVEGVRTR